MISAVKPIYVLWPEARYRPDLLRARHEICVGETLASGPSTDSIHDIADLIRMTLQELLGACVFLVSQNDRGAKGIDHCVAIGMKNKSIADGTAESAWSEQRQGNSSKAVMVPSPQLTQSLNSMEVPQPF
jgi:hypothetical protein